MTGPDSPARHPRAPGPILAALVVMLLCALWGSTWLVIKVGLLEKLPVFTSAALRFTLAALVFSAVAPFLHRHEGGRAPSAWLSVFMGFAVFAVPYGIVYHGQQLIPSGLASVLWSVFPMLMAVSGHYLLGERLGRGHWLGFVAGFLGVGLLFATDLRALGSIGLWTGAVFMLSPLLSAVGNTVVKRTATDVSSLLLNRNGMAIGSLLLWTAAWANDENVLEVQFTPAAVFSISYLALMGTVVTFGLYYWLLRHVSASRLALIAYVAPLIALVLGWTLGNEEVGLHTLGGAACILLGVTLARRPAN